MKKIFILFDIDGTLISSEYKHEAEKLAGHYLLAAMAQVFLGHADKHHEFNLSGLKLNGTTDGGCVLLILHHNQIITEDQMNNPDTELSDKVRYCCNQVAANFLSEDIKNDKWHATQLPAVTPFLNKLKQCDRFVVGLLTGNFAVCAKLKLEAGNIDIRNFMIEPSYYEYENEHLRQGFLQIIAVVLKNCSTLKFCKNLSPLIFQLELRRRPNL